VGRSSSMAAADVMRTMDLLRMGICLEIGSISAGGGSGGICCTDSFGCRLSVDCSAPIVLGRTECSLPVSGKASAGSRCRKLVERAASALALASGAVAIMAVGRWASMAAADVMCPMGVCKLEVGTISGGGGSGGNGCTDSLGCSLSVDCSAPIVLGRTGSSRQPLCLRRGFGEFIHSQHT
jgi:hypothetical protein